VAELSEPEPQRAIRPTAPAAPALDHDGPTELHGPFAPADGPARAPAPPTPAGKRLAGRPRPGATRQGRAPGATHTQATATQPLVLWRLAKSTAKAGLQGGPDAPLPVQHYVHTQERAALATQLRGAAQALAAVVARVLRSDTELRAAELRLRDADLRLAALEHRHLVWLAEPRPDGEPDRPAPPHLRPPAGIPGVQAPARRSLLGPWAGRTALAVIAAGQAGLLYLAGPARGLAPAMLTLLCIAVAGATMAAVQIPARSLDRLAAGADGLERPRRRRVLDTVAGSCALAGVVALALALARLRPGGPGGQVPQTWLTVASTALIVVGIAVGYATIPADPDQAQRRRRSLAQLVGRFLVDRQRRRELRRARAHQQATRQAVERHWIELAELVGQLSAAEIDAVQSWRQQAAIGDAAQHAVEQHLLEFGARHGRGVAQRVTGWWRGRRRVAPEPSHAFPSISETQPDWPAQVLRITAPARAVLARRGLLDPDDPPAVG
jgi:hypothetical protein